MKILVLDNYESFSLVPYLKEQLVDDEVVKMGNIHTEPMWEILKTVDADVIMTDFCDQNAVVLTNRVNELKRKPKIVIRLHAYEAFCGFIHQVNWDVVDHLITVSPSYAELVKTKVPSHVDVRMIYNGLDLEKYKLQDENFMDDNAIAFIANLNRKKGMALLRTVMASFPSREFHIGGVSQEEQVSIYMHDLPLSNVHYYGRVDTAEFLKGKRYLLSTSIHESFGMTIAEGMAMGLTPMVHGWAGADRLWPKECIWNTFQEFDNIGKKSVEWCRSWIEDRYSIQRCIDDVVDTLKQ